jgi:hypothetical protein
MEDWCLSYRVESRRPLVNDPDLSGEDSPHPTGQQREVGKRIGKP